MGEAEYTRAVPQVVVVGSAARDVTPDDPRGWRLGGGVTYGALTVARLGLHGAALIGVDAAAAGAWELDLLRRAGVELVIAPLAHGPVFENVERPGGRVQTCLDPGEPLLPGRLPIAWAEAPAWLLAPVAGELPDGWAHLPVPEACVAFAWQGILRRLAAGARVEPLAPGPSELLRRADLVGVSRHDLIHDLPLTALYRWLGRESELLLTCGEEGGLLIALDEGRVRRVVRYPALAALDVDDPTGAGDVMLACLLAARAVGGAAARAAGRDLRVGAAAASLVVQRPGLLGVPTLAAVRQRLVGAR